MFVTVFSKTEATCRIAHLLKTDAWLKIGLVFDKLHMATYDTAEVQNEIASDLVSQKPPDRTGPEISDPDRFLEQLMKKPEKNPTREDGQTKNPTEARTAKRAQSEPESKRRKAPRKKDGIEERTRSGARRSVRKELSDIKAEMEKESRRSAPGKKQTQVIEHKDPTKKKRES